MNRYPRPVMVWIKRGRSGSSFNTCRILRIAPLMLLSVSRKTSLPQIFSTICSRVTSCPLLYEAEEDFCGNALQFEHTTGATQFITVRIELEIFTKLDCLLDGY